MTGLHSQVTGEPRDTDTVTCGSEGGCWNSADERRYLVGSLAYCTHGSGRGGRNRPAHSTSPAVSSTKGREPKYLSQVVCHRASAARDLGCRTRWSGHLFPRASLTRSSRRVMSYSP